MEGTGDGVLERIEFDVGGVSALGAMPGGVVGEDAAGGAMVGELFAGANPEAVGH